MILPPKCDKVWSLTEDSFILNNLVLKKTDLQKLLNNKLSKNKGYDALENRRQHLLGAEWKKWDSHEKLLEWETRKSISAETKTFILDRDNNKILIDYEDYEYLIDYNWINKMGYAVCCVKGNYYFMHRLLMDNPEDPFEVDHIDKNRLNNKKSNLRLATRSQNAANSKDYKLKYKGVNWNPSGNSWHVKCNGKYFGSFKNKDSAANCYNEYAKLIYGEFAHLNKCPFIPKDEWQKQLLSK